MSYSTMKDVQKQIHCFMLGEEAPRACAAVAPDRAFPIGERQASALYQTNADPANPLHCRSPPPTYRKTDAKP